MKKINYVNGITLAVICITTSFVSLSAASGNWYSGQQYDLNGFNTCSSTQLSTSSQSFTARVVDEFNVQLGTKTMNLAQNSTIQLVDAGGVGSKECQILTTSTSHSPGFNSKQENAE